MKPLSDREQLFVSHYLYEPIATAAALKAGYARNNADQTGMKLLRRPHVAEAIRAAQAARAVKLQLDANTVLEELARIGLADITTYFCENGTLKPMSEWPTKAGHLIASVKTSQRKTGNGDGEVTITELKLWDKVSALDKLAKHFGLLLEHREQTTQEKIDSMTDKELDQFISEALKIGALNLKAIDKTEDKTPDA